jgi:hypothetical protein
MANRILRKKGEIFEFERNMFHGSDIAPEDRGNECHLSTMGVMIQTVCGSEQSGSVDFLPSCLNFFRVEPQKERGSDRLRQF